MYSVRQQCIDLPTIWKLHMHTFVGNPSQKQSQLNFTTLKLRFFFCWLCLKCFCTFQSKCKLSKKRSSSANILLALSFTVTLGKHFAAFRAEIFWEVPMLCTVKFALHWHILRPIIFLIFFGVDRPVWGLVFLPGDL